MTTTKLQFESILNNTFLLKTYSSITPDILPVLQKNLDTLLNHPMSGFQNLEICQRDLEECEIIYKKFSHKKHFIHVGMGGSVLGAQVLIDALAPKDSPIIFLNNLDADDIAQKLSTIDLKNAVIYLVSKSGETLETHLMLQLLLQQLKLHKDLKNTSENDLLKNYFIFATDPHRGKMRKMINEIGISSVTIPSNLGGRFCAFSVVTFLPALFANIDVRNFYHGAMAVKNFFASPNMLNTLFKISSLLAKENDLGKTQTVIMPYSSKLKSFTHWFAQLWGESLGKKNEQNQATGLTPIVAHGPADQHSLLQLFMEGPNDKNYFFISINEFNNQYDSFGGDLEGKSLTKIVHAQREGTMAALQKNNATMFLLEINRLDAYTLGELMYFFEFLTVATGAALSIDPYNQPGVELGKSLTWSALKNGLSPLLN